MNYRLLLILIILVNFGLRLWAIDRGSLWDVQPDESPRVTRAVQIVSTGNLNHGYFNHPSSTVIYPLAAVYYIWGIVAYRGSFWGANPFLETVFKINPGEFYLLGRYFIIALTTATIPLIYLLGQALFNKRVGLIGTVFWITIPGIVHYSQVVRDDLAAVFFTVLSLWLCLKLIDQSSLWRQVGAGFAIGLAIATRYLMAPLGLLLLMVEAILWRQGKQDPAKRKQFFLQASCGLLSVVLAFMLSTPYFFLDLAEVQRDLLYESRSEHVGADGLLPLENFLWYWTDAIPANITWSLYLLAFIGVAVVALKPTVKQVLALGFVIIFLGVISLHPLHWSRWAIPILPIVVLLAAQGLDFLALKLSTRLGLRPAQQNQLLVLAVVALSISPTISLIQQLSHQLHPGTPVLARKWIMQNIPEGSGIVLEAGTAVLEDSPFSVFQTAALPTAGYTMEQAYRFGYRYIVLNMNLYNQYAHEAGRYEAELALYQTLFDKGVLLQEIDPSATQSGPTIRIYELPVE